MAYDEGLAVRIEEILTDIAPSDCVEKKMFGGVCFMVAGNVACGVHKDRLIVRVGPERHAEMLAKPNVTVFDITGHPMKGWITVTPEGYEDDSDLTRWVENGVAFARSLPQK